MWIYFYNCSFVRIYNSPKFLKIIKTYQIEFLDFLDFEILCWRTQLRRIGFLNFFPWKVCQTVKTVKYLAVFDT